MLSWRLEIGSRLMRSITPASTHNAMPARVPKKMPSRAICQSDGTSGARATGSSSPQATRKTRKPTPLRRLNQNHSTTNSAIAMGAIVLSSRPW